MNEDLAVGDEVHLSENSQWPRTSMNPRNTVGTVISMSIMSHVRVHWSNGTTNLYNKKDSDLIPVKRITPSATSGGLLCDAYLPPTDNLGEVAISVTKDLCRGH
jgi:hypothetical protein